MAWFLIAIAATVSLWAASLWRILYSSSPSCIPSTPRFLASEPGKKRNVLLVVAHPDDESMFFTPTILFLHSEGHNIHILCMSTGNAEGIGDTRKDELYRACVVLKIPLKQVKVLDHPSLQDGFDKPWDHHLLARIIEDQIKVWDIDSLITFDNYGVSGHPNHSDVHHGICVLLYGNLQNNYEAWELDKNWIVVTSLRAEAVEHILNDGYFYKMVSRSIFRKYTGPCDVWTSIFGSLFNLRVETCCLLNNHPYRSYLAMAEHDSQWLWFRKLFVLFSSYTYMNALRKINSLP